jgi:dephospho-CoA kinase
MLLRVGLTGGIASGKSVVGRELKRLGCHLIEADLLGHQVLLPDGEAYRPVVALFGETILDPITRVIDRKKLGEIVFAAPRKLEALSAVVHPAVRRMSAEIIRGIPNGIVVYEAAILIETGGYKDFDRLIVAACPEEMQVARAMARDGVDRQTVLARILRQLPLAEKVLHAHYVVDTSGTLEQTLEQTRNIYQALVVYGENVT